VLIKELSPWVRLMQARESKMAVVIKTQPCTSQGVPAILLREISTLRMLQHPNVALFREVVQGPASLSLVMGFAGPPLRSLLAAEALEARENAGPSLAALEWERRSLKWRPIFRQVCPRMRLASTLALLALFISSCAHSSSSTAWRTCTRTAWSTALSAQTPSASAMAISACAAFPMCGHLERPSLPRHRTHITPPSRRWPGSRTRARPRGTFGPRAAWA
jgi:hypothetical protein